MHLVRHLSGGTLSEFSAIACQTLLSLWLAKEGLPTKVVWLPTKYSVSFDFRELRFCGRALHTACEGAGDARGCPRAAGRCATWCGTPQKRRRHGRFCAQHAQRCDVALRTTAVSGEPNQPVADRVSCPTIGTTLSTCADSSMLISVLRFLRAIDVEIVGVERS